MSSSHFASGEELFHAKNRNQVLLPSWGTKESEVSGTWFEEKQIDVRLQDRHELISELRIAKKDQLAIGNWIDASKMVLLTHQAGTFWEFMGVETDIGRCLYPEEALYLIEMGELEVIFGDMPLSMQSAQSVMLLDDFHLDLYYVYAHLTRCGCKVVRHQPHIRFTKYEKQIRLDQHQVKKNRTKLKLKAESSKAIPQENEQDIQLLSEKSVKDAEVVDLEKPDLDEALKDFYSVIGDEITSVPGTCSNEKVLDISKTDCTVGKVPEMCELVDLTKDINDYEQQRKVYLDLFPCMLGMTSQTIYGEDPDLLPENSKPSKKEYKISLEILNYYSKYLDDGNHNNKWGGGMTNRWNRGRGNNYWRQNKSKNFHNFNNTFSSFQRDYSWRNNRSDSGNRSFGRGTGMYMDSDHFNRERNVRGRYNDSVHNRAYGRSSDVNDFENRYRFRDESRSLQKSRGSLYDNLAEKVSLRENITQELGDSIPQEHRWDENGRYSLRQANNIRNDNFEDLRIGCQRNFRENNQGDCSKIQDGYERRDDESMRHAFRRENNSHWRDELDYEKKRARIDYDDRKERQGMYHGNRLDMAYQIRDDRWQRQENVAERNWDRTDMSKEDRWERQEKVMGENWSRHNNKWKRGGELEEEVCDKRGLNKDDRWGRGEKDPEENWSRIRLQSNDIRERQSTLSENIRDRSDQSFEARWKRPKTPIEKGWDETRNCIDNKNERWEKLPPDNLDVNRQGMGHNMMYHPEPGTTRQRNEPQFTFRNLNETDRERRDDLRNSCRSSQEMLQYEGLKGDYRLCQDKTIEERWSSERDQFKKEAEWDSDKKIDSGSRPYDPFEDEKSDVSAMKSDDTEGSKTRSQSYENTALSNTARKQKPDWHQHDDRGSDQNSQCDTMPPSSEDSLLNKVPDEPELDLSVTPKWKTRRRKRRRDGVETYPCYLVKLPVKVNSWKEYKNIVNSMSEEKILSQGCGEALWRGPSVPLIKPTMATTLENVLNNCSLENKYPESDMVYPLQSYLVLHYDVYLPKVVYRKSSPSIPSKRITVMRNAAVPSLKQIQEVTKRFPDEAPVVCAVVTSGEVRLYTLSPITLPSPDSS